MSLKRTLLLGVIVWSTGFSTVWAVDQAATLLALDEMDAQFSVLDGFYADFLDTFATFTTDLELAYTGSGAAFAAAMTPLFDEYDTFMAAGRPLCEAHRALVEAEDYGTALADCRSALLSFRKAGDKVTSMGAAMVNHMQASPLPEGISASDAGYTMKFWRKVLLSLGNLEYVVLLHLRDTWI